MSDLQTNRLVRTFARLRADGRKTLLPFLTAGYPDLDTTADLLADFESRGVSICEIGIPFSDPIADGPTIQNSYTHALDAGVRSETVFRMVADYRRAGGNLALVAMVSCSIVFRHGTEDYLRRAADAGFDAVLVPDLPFDEADALRPAAQAAGLAHVLLIAPTTPPQRRIRIAQQSQGFIYFISVAGITGRRDSLPPETLQAVAELRRHTDTPICVGFGISRPETVDAVCRTADGAIVGSAIIHRITECIDLPRRQLVRQVGEFLESLLAPIR